MEFFAVQFAIWYHPTDYRIFSINWGESIALTGRTGKIHPVFGQCDALALKY